MSSSFSQRDETPDATVTRRSRANPMRGVIAIVQRDDQFLVIQRSATVRAPLMWCFPGGEIESGESETAALVREMREELNVDARAVRRLAIREKHEGRLILHCWQAEIVAGEPSPNPVEVAQCHWMTIGAIRSLSDLLPGTLEIAEAAPMP